VAARTCARQLKEALERTAWDWADWGNAAGSRFLPVVTDTSAQPFKLQHTA